MRISAPLQCQTKPLPCESRAASAAISSSRPASCSAHVTVDNARGWRDEMPAVAMCRLWRGCDSCGASRAPRRWPQSSPPSSHRTRVTTATLRSPSTCVAALDTRTFRLAEFVRRQEDGEEFFCQTFCQRVIILYKEGELLPRRCARWGRVSITPSARARWAPQATLSQSRTRLACACGAREGTNTRGWRSSTFARLSYTRMYFLCVRGASCALQREGES